MKFINCKPNISEAINQVEEKDATLNAAFVHDAETKRVPILQGAPKAESKHQLKVTMLIKNPSSSPKMTDSKNN